MQIIDPKELQEYQRLLDALPEYDWLTKSDQSFFNLQDVASFWHVGNETVKQWITDGDIPGAVMVGRNTRLPRSGLVVCFGRMIKSGTQAA